MDERSMAAFSLLLSLAGLVLIYLFSGGTGEPTEIGAIDYQDIGTSVEVCGNVTSFRVSKNHIFMDLDDGTGRMTYVIFNSSAESLSDRGISPYTLGAGQEVCAPGVVDEYPKGSGEMEIVYKRGDIRII